MTTDLKSIGLGFDRWQEAVEAAIATNQLVVAGELRGGQLVQFTDYSGAQINILAVEPFATYAGFESITQTFAHIQMVNDVLAFCEIVDPFGTVLAPVTLNLSQGPLLVDEPVQQWQQLGVTALATEATVHENAEAFSAATGETPGQLVSEGAKILESGSGAAIPDAAASFSARVLEAEYRSNQLTGQRFIHATVDGIFPFDVCLPDAPALPVKDNIISGTAVLTGNVLAPISSGGCGGGGCGGGGCGCGGH
ncbi:hypothetical protein COCCU_08475 [Corynebacterium occultum]|uniref:Uncharacterized protein n=1 Tax=Corynebacterium occultum TaxID=2675219 RepID=A0A6B8VX07_9CORY|nr:hypothetical protein [Corynebacterium occultum]QGU07619.1 hypothetical protein COCCU_08475 [Corynebacterium occultum]